MCCRYYFSKNEPAFEALIARILASPLRERFEKEFSRPVITDGEVRPTDIVPVIASNRNGERSVFPMKWGFTIPNTKSPVVNARVESAAEKPLFKEAWQRRRCIIPASWYYEWEHLPAPDGKTKTGAKYMIQPAGHDITWLCGLYSFENDLPVFAVITRAPEGEAARIHDRMPLILPSEMINEWISPDSNPASLLSHALTNMILEKVV